MASFAYTTNGDGTGALGGFGGAIGAPQLENLYKRESQFDYKVKQIGAIAAAYRDPAQYFELKQDALRDAGAAAARVYREEFQKLIAGLVPAQSAHARAKKLADTYAELLRADVETDFPSDLNNLSLQLHYNTGAYNAANGFIAPSTSTGSRIGGGKKHRKSRK